MVRHSLFVGLALALVTIVTGALECNPVVLTPAQQHGADLYAQMCAVCHGANGEGYKADHAPALRNQNFQATASDAFLRHAIANGRRGTTMSAWATGRGGPLTPEDLNALLAYLRTWRPREKPKLDESRSLGMPERGAPVFLNECQKCHGAKGLDGSSVSIGDPELLSTASNGFLRYAIRYGRPGTAMPAFQGKLSDGQIEDLVGLLRSYQVVPPPPPPPRPVSPVPPLPLGPVPLNPKGPEPVGFNVAPGTTKVDVIKAQLDRHAKMAILDARAPSDYTYDHIAGAVSVPFYDPAPYFDKLPKDSWLVCYCACPHAESGQLAQKLGMAGFKKVTILDEGLGVWKMKGNPTNKGTAP